MRERKTNNICPCGNGPPGAILHALEASSNISRKTKATISATKSGFSAKPTPIGRHGGKEDLVQH
jgi:hypothetical protein